MTVIDLSLETSKINVQDVINMTKYNSFTRLCRVTGFVFRFIKNMKLSLRKKYNELVKDDDVTVEELEYAEILWLKECQRAMTLDSKFPQLTKSLNLYCDEDNLLRARTRLSETVELKNDVKFPIVLPSCNHITTIIILDAHHKVLHMKTLLSLNDSSCYHMF